MLRRMRITVRLDDDLLVRVRQHAAEERTTFTQIVDEALRDLLRRKGASAEERRLPLPTFEGRGLQPGVDLDDSAALLDLMEGRS